ncbi:RING/U-box superfamily protein [Striga hermonthica]|uniref:RING/U-box superfamily protein n=1 Tax=Striga hermonthica TaxID=68872 RepID=A0A9N7RE48_STRHE|nr:RING/U-box superfamily protein [Striga hermonthica]
MASSQVEIATSSPFGFRQNSLNKLVNSSCMPNDNKSHSHHIDFDDLWVHHPQWKTTTTTTTPNNNPSGPTNTTTTTTSSNNNNKKDNNNNNNKDNWSRARQIIFPIDRDKLSSNDRSSEGSNLRGVSSLVQKWRGFEAKRSSTNSNNNNIISRTTNVDNYADPPTPAPSLNEDSYGDWDSNYRTCGSPSDSETERLRVADIIKKLTDNNETGCESPRTSLPNQSEPIVNSPRIRGRQAFNDLLVRMERDRHIEIQGIVARRPVSKFSHRGRIQALLRFRFLHRGMEAKEYCYPNHKSSQTQKSQYPSSLNARERPNFSKQSDKEVTKNDTSTILRATNVQKYENGSNEVMCTKRLPKKKMTNHILDHPEGSMTCSQSSHHQTTLDAQENVGLLLYSYEKLDHEMRPFSIFMKQETNLEEVKSELNARSDSDIENNIRENFEYNIEMCNIQNKKKEANGVHEVIESNHNQTTRGDCEEFSSSNNCMYWESDVLNQEIGWEELQCDDDDDDDNQQKEERNKEWIDEVSRPRSDWEGLRQERYQEMLDPFQDNNEDIRVLLGRKTVSTFLSSALRKKIDQVMIARAQAPQILNDDQRQTEQKVSVSTKPEKWEEEEEQNGKENYNIDNFNEQQNNDSDDYTDVITQSPLESWSQLNQGRELSDYSIRLASLSAQESSSHYYSENGQPNSSDSVHPSLDLELIYDLRRHMEQLHREMSELKNSIKCCMDMQIKLQCSIKNEDTKNLHNSETKNGRQCVANKVASEGKCCVCCKMQIDSLLYRCGHMCTCFKCAHKLQWNSGKCPICKAPILDVVRTYSNHS